MSVQVSQSESKWDRLRSSGHKWHQERDQVNPPSSQSYSPTLVGLIGMYIYIYIYIYLYASVPDSRYDRLCMLRGSYILISAQAAALLVHRFVGGRRRAPWLCPRTAVASGIQMSRSFVCWYAFAVSCRVITVFQGCPNQNIWIASRHFEHTSTYACIFVCMYVCMYVCIYAFMHACMYICMHILTYVCAYVRMCVMYVCT